MNDRKQHVVQTAHQLFIEKGFQATSIQDILEYSGISKGTFYNYFSSKNELLIAIFKTSYIELQKVRDEVLIGEDPSNIETFIKQIEIQLTMNRKKRLITLFEEVMVSNDADLKQFIEKGQIRNIRWIYSRFLDIFGEDKKRYLLDCAIMFMGILRENIKFYRMANDENLNIRQVVRYTVNRIAHIAAELTESDEQLIQTEALERWLPDCKKPGHLFRKKFLHSLFTLKNIFHQSQEHVKYTELLEFIEEELIESKNPRSFLIESVLQKLKTVENPVAQKELIQLDQLIDDYFKQVEIENP
ncbi:TetR/AcrR family transcriptional regulator [Neobacillus mesonae]|uniref:TetR family transcriptional regulator n=1 Tax=Neobacillus mesonae TaxID=1193713 RepID=A0A3T0HYI3_9BACI|nr:TetR/AcrR family transcriptional regulator [Neobacillus mesonae]AZU62204.1 TetR family transcriptional regulator [Neobacillus mesonae]MED4205549.1 TetR/AcrR family transcriptional regulator [Neobacillus mesonae]